MTGRARALPCAVLCALTTCGVAQRLRTASLDAALRPGSEGPELALRVHTAEGWREALRAAQP